MKKRSYLVILIIAIVVLMCGSYIYTKSKNNLSANESISSNANTTNNDNANTANAANAEETAKKQADEQAKKNEEEAKSLEKQAEEEKSALNGAKPVKTDVAQDTVKKLIDIVYFKKGNYDEYKSLFALQDRVVSKDKFDEARNKAKLTDKFGKEYKSSDEIVKRFKVEKTTTLTKVSFKSEDGEKESTWQIIEKNGKYLIYNAAIQS